MPRMYSDPLFHHGLRASMLALAPSKLGRTELLEAELLRRRARWSPGSVGFRPDDLAKRLSMSDSDTTPVRRPERWAPGSAAAGTEEEKAPPTPTAAGRGDRGGPPLR